MDVSLIGSFNQQKGLEDTWSNIWSRAEMETTESIEVHDAKATSYWGLMAATWWRCLLWALQVQFQSPSWYFMMIRKTVQCRDLVHFWNQSLYGFSVFTDKLLQLRIPLRTFWALRWALFLTSRSSSVATKLPKQTPPRQQFSRNPAKAPSKFHHEMAPSLRFRWTYL